MSKRRCLVLVCYRNYRYPGCTTRTSVPSQPTVLQKPSYKKEPYLQIKNHTTTATQPNTTQPPPNPTQANTLNTQHPNPTSPPSPTQPNPERKKISGKSS